MVEKEFESIWGQLQRELTEARANGELDEEDEKKSEEDLKSDYESIAKRRVRLGLLISRLADINKIKLSDGEVRMAIFQEAMRYSSQSDEVIKYYANNKQALQNLVAPLLEDKVVDFILDQSNAVERNVDFLTLKQVVRGVIPTPYDAEFEENNEDGQKESKTLTSKEGKLKVEKEVKVKGKKA
jgi:trigger factor